MVIRTTLTKAQGTPSSWTALSNTEANQWSATNVATNTGLIWQPTHGWDCTYVG